MLISKGSINKFSLFPEVFIHKTMVAHSKHTSLGLFLFFFGQEHDDEQDDEEDTEGREDAGIY